VNLALPPPFLLLSQIPFDLKLPAMTVIIRIFVRHVFTFEGKMIIQPVALG